MIGRLKARGVGVVYVSHKMDEIWRLCDRMTVLRDGRLVGSRRRKETDGAELIRMMVGRHLDVSKTSARKSSSEELLRVEDLGTRKLRDVSFTLHAGEVLGVAGVMGAGRSELGAVLYGLRELHGGTIFYRGEAFDVRRRQSRRHIGLVPEDRKSAGLMMHMSIRENATMCVLPQVQRFGVIARRMEQARTEPVRERLQIKCRSMDQEVGALSGGNQQKTLLARWLLRDPKILFLDDPARGVDVGAKEDIYAMIAALAAQGKGILLASSELPELLRCCDRILVLHEGRLKATLPGQTTTQETIMTAATAQVPAK